MASAQHPVWAYKLRSNDPAVIQFAVCEMAAEIARVDLVESVICPFARSVHSAMDGSVTETSENELTVDFENRQIQLPKLTFSSHSLPSRIDVDLIRYAAFICTSDYDTRSKEMHVVALSTWQKQNKDIHNIYLVMNQSEALLLMNAVSRLINKQSLKKALQFYPLLTGIVMVSSCTPVQHSEKKKNCCSPQKVMSFILDPESLSFFEHSFSSKPMYDFRFYKEQGPKSIDIVYVSRDFSNLHLQQQTQVCIIRKHPNTDEEAFDKLIQLFKKHKIKPQPEEYFMSPEEYDISAEAPQHSGRSPKKSQLESAWTEPIWQRMDEQNPNEQWLNDLYTGDHITRNIDEEVQLMWCTYEHDLRECIEMGAVPESIIESGGLDPSSHNHLQRSVEDIKDQLLNNEMNLALSRLQACLSTFKDTLLQPVSTLDQVELMKRIYFLSGRD